MVPGWPPSPRVPQNSICRRLATAELEPAESSLTTDSITCGSGCESARRPESHSSCRCVCARTPPHTHSCKKRLLHSRCHKKNKQTSWISCHFSPRIVGRLSSSDRPCTSALCARCRKPSDTSWLRRESSCRVDTETQLTYLKHGIQMWQPHNLHGSADPNQ